MYPEYILKKLRMRNGYDENDRSHDEWFNQMDKNNVFNEVLEWDGLIGGWGGIIRGYVEGIYGVKLRDE